MNTPSLNARLKSYFYNGFLGYLLVYISAGTLFIFVPLFFNWRISNYFKAKKTPFFIIEHPTCFLMRRRGRSMKSILRKINPSQCRLILAASKAMLKTPFVNN